MNKFQKALVNLFDLRMEYLLNGVDLPQELEQALDNSIKTALCSPIYPEPVKKLREAALTIREIYLEKSKIEFDDLEAKLKAIMKYRRNKEVLLRADKDLTHGFVINVMAGVKEAGIEKLGIITEPME